MSEATGLSQDIHMMNLSDTLPSMENSFLYELVENHIVQFGELVQASNLVLQNNLQLSSTWSSWERLQEVLHGLGFRWQGNDPWHKLGFSLHEGPSPSLTMVEQRWDLAQLILQGAAGRPGLTEHLGDVQIIGTTLAQAKVDCTEYLKTNKIKRNRGKLSSFGAWQEAGLDLLEYGRRKLPLAKICLQLSEVHQTPNLGPNIVPTKQARLIHDVLIKGIVDPVSFIQTFGGQHYVLWVPGENDGMIRMMGSLMKLALQFEDQAISFSLVLPFQAPPCAQSVEDITDLFSHPLLGNKWASIIAKREFLVQPGSYTFSGTYGPITASRSSLWVTLGRGTAGIPQEEIVHWKTSLASFEFWACDHN